MISIKKLSIILLSCFLLSGCAQASTATSKAIKSSNINISSTKEVSSSSVNYYLARQTSGFIVVFFWALGLMFSFGGIMIPWLLLIAVIAFITDMISHKGSRKAH